MSTGKHDNAWEEKLETSPTNFDDIMTDVVNKKRIAATTVAQRNKVKETKSQPTTNTRSRAGQTKCRPLWIRGHCVGNSYSSIEDRGSKPPRV